MNDKVGIEHLVNPFYLQAMLHMGLIQIPNVESKIDLEAARESIDIVNYIEAVTKNNISQDEEKLLKDIIMQLQMQYFEIEKNEKNKNIQKEEK